MGLVVCECCNRHVRALDPECPFCRARSVKLARSLGVALVVGGGLFAAVGCGPRPSMPAYGPPPMDDPSRADGGQLTVWKDDAGAAEEAMPADASTLD